MKIILLSLIALALHAQTGVKTDQIRAAPAPAVQLLAIDQQGRLIRLALGPGVQIAGGAITATADTAPPVLVAVRLKRDAAGNYPATTGIVTRNGVVQERGGDYTVTGAGLVPGVPWDEDDIVLAITAERAVAVPVEARKP